MYCWHNHGNFFLIQTYQDFISRPPSNSTKINTNKVLRNSSFQVFLFFNKNNIILVCIIKKIIR